MTDRSLGELLCLTGSCEIDLSQRLRLSQQRGPRQKKAAGLDGEEHVLSTVAENGARFNPNFTFASKFQ